MDGIHDLGGKQGYGRVERDVNELVFHDRWEAGVFAIRMGAVTSGALANTDQFRHAIERIDPGAYLTHGYYGRWLGGIESLLVESGALTAGAIDEAFRERGGKSENLVAARPSAEPDTVDRPKVPGTSKRRLKRQPKFATGDIITTLPDGVLGHTRLPAYARGKKGKIVLFHGAWVFPDTNAHGRGENPQHLYTVSFKGKELWGADAEANIFVTIDLFESYLL